MKSVFESLAPSSFHMSNGLEDFDILTQCSNLPGLKPVKCKIVEGEVKCVASLSSELMSHTWCHRLMQHRWLVKALFFF